MYVLPKFKDFFVVENLRHAHHSRLALSSSPVHLVDVNQILRSKLIEVVVPVHFNKLI